VVSDCGQDDDNKDESAARDNHCTNVESTHQLDTVDISEMWELARQMAKHEG